MHDGDNAIAVLRARRRQRVGKSSRASEREGKRGRENARMPHTVNIEATKNEQNRKKRKWILWQQKTNITVQCELLAKTGHYALARNETHVMVVRETRLQWEHLPIAFTSYMAK